jgi:type IV secretory pathway protease TraF
MPSQIPPYLTSGASSRAHHALLVKLHEAASDQEERGILAKEVVRLKEVLAVAGQSNVCYERCSCL